MIGRSQVAQARRAALAPVAHRLTAVLAANLARTTDPTVRQEARRLLFEVADAAGLAPPALDCPEATLGAWLAEHGILGQEHEGVPHLPTYRRGRLAVQPATAERRGARFKRWLRRVVAP
jgi:hypothetical protein